MKGIFTFKTRAEAINAGYTIFDRNAEHYLARIFTNRGWAIAIVLERPQ